MPLLQKKKIDVRSSLYMKMLHQEMGIKKSVIAQRFKHFAKRSVYRHAAGDILQKRGNAASHQGKPRGRPKKLSDRDERLIVNSLKKLRKEQASFTAKKIQDNCQLTHVSTKSVHRTLHKYGYRYLQSRKKGLVYAKDKVRRLKFAKEARKFAEDFWTKSVVFYFDGVGFGHKTNPNAEARSTANMAWRKKKEGLSRTTKEKKEGSGGKMANFFVAIAHGHGTVLCKQYDWRVTGKNFAEFVLRCFPEAFEKCGVPPCRQQVFTRWRPTSKLKSCKRRFRDAWV